MATNYTNGLLTGGLGIGIPACAMMITATTFNLGPCGIDIKFVADTGYSKVFQPGEIASMYQPVPDNLQPFPPEILDKMYTPYQVPVEKTKIQFKLRIGEKVFEREYLVRANRRKIVIRVLNVVNATKDLMKATVKNLKTVFHKISVRVKNFKNHK